MYGKDQQIHSFIPSDIYAYMKTRFNFFTLLSFKRTCFKFYSVAILLCYLCFTIYRTAHKVFGTLW